MKLKKVLIIFYMMNITTSFAQLSPIAENEIKKQTLKMYELYKDLHQHPELSLKEYETSQKMAAMLRNAGFEVTENFGGNNVVGLMKNGEGPVIMLRTDMDALPVEEKTNLPFASTSKSENSNGEEVAVMHACGHDIHMSVWAGAIQTLAALKNQWKGTLLVIAQQAEEVSGGAGLAIENGLFTKYPKPDCALAFHINPELESGTIGLAGGPVFAGVKTARIRVFGKGGHGAYPEKCIDPVVIASRIVLDLQTIVSRELSPLEPAVVTVGSIHGGTRPNIIPDEVDLELTLRYYSDETIEKVIAAIKRISKSASQMAGMAEDKLPVVKIDKAETPPVVNNEKLSETLREITATTIGEQNIIKTKPAMVGEDFGEYGKTPENIPVCLIWLGSTSSQLMKELSEKGEKPAPLHSPYLITDYEKTIETGIRVMTGNVLRLMEK